MPLAIALAASLAWAVVTVGDAQRTGAEAASTAALVAAAGTDLDGTRDALTTETAAVAAAEGEIDTLRARSERRAVCIAAQTSDLAAMQRLLDAQEANNARAATDSDFGYADRAVWKAYDKVLADLSQAYKAAGRGNYSAAITWLKRADRDGAAAVRLETKLNAEIDAINQATDAINGQQEELDERQRATASTCGL